MLTVRLQVIFILFLYSLVFPKLLQEICIPTVIIKKKRVFFLDVYVD